MTENVFVYGTLMYPQVLQTLLNRVPRNEKAVINGYRRFAINGQVFPGTIPSTPDCSVQGVLLYELTPEEMVVFDEFEGDEYYKEAVQPQILDASGVATGNSAQASVYLWQRSLRHLLIGDWDPELFEKTKLESYVGMCTSFIEELREQQGRPQNRPLGFQ